MKIGASQVLWREPCGRRVAWTAIALAMTALCSAPRSAEADAIVRTQAMLASTILEMFVSEGRVVSELEIGASDLPAFVHLMPDEIAQRAGDRRPLAERFPEFFQRDMVVAVSGGEPIPPRVTDIQIRPRVRRDEITGEPLAPEEGVEPETVVFVRLEYVLPPQPASLELGAPGVVGAAGVGFVLYHEGIAVNDFRYLGRRHVVRLDWDDPWYSDFEHRNLRRAYFEPMSGFLYVEPYEVRREIIVRPKDLQRWVDLGLEGRDTIPPQIQPEVRQRVRDFLAGHHLVSIDGTPREPDLVRIDFLERTLKSSRVIDPPEELDLDAAMLGMISIYLTDGLPQQVTMPWDLWDERVTRVPAASVDEAGPLPTYLFPDAPVLEWTNFLTNPTLPTLVEVASPPNAAQKILALARWPLALAAAGLAASAVWLLARGDRRRMRATVAAVACGLVAVGGFAFGQSERPSVEGATEVVSGLLHNVYRAFDFHQEEKIYDVLARSVEGDLLTDLYLETRRGLELANQGGARAKVKELEMQDVEPRRGSDGGFEADTSWIVRASVGHWGHVHQRQNRYRALLDVRPVNGDWKLVAVEILEEQRL